MGGFAKILNKAFVYWIWANIIICNYLYKHDLSGDYWCTRACTKSKDAAFELFLVCKKFNNYEQLEYPLNNCKGKLVNYAKRNSACNFLNKSTSCVRETLFSF